MFTGCGTALVTPFRKDLSLDEPTLRALVRRQIDAGINFLVPCGTTGESPLSPAEHLRVVEITLKEPRASPCARGAGGQHRKGSSSPGARVHGRRRHPPSSLLQQAHSGRPLPALLRDRRRNPAAHRRLQRAGRTGVNVNLARSRLQNQEHRRRQRGQRRRPDGHHPQRSPPISSCSPATTPSRFPRRPRRSGIISVASTKSCRDDADRPGLPSSNFAAAAPSRPNSCR